jgi:hypothetical protein
MEAPPEYKNLNIVDVCLQLKEHEKFYLMGVLTADGHHITNPGALPFMARGKVIHAIAKVAIREAGMGKKETLAWQILVKILNTYPGKKSSSQPSSVTSTS